MELIDNRHLEEDGRCLDKETDIQTYGRIDGQTNRQTDRLTDRPTHGQADLRKALRFIQRNYFIWSVDVNSINLINLINIININNITHDQH